MKIAVHFTVGFERQGILHIEVALHRSAEFDILANDIAVDHSLATRGNASLGIDLTVEGSVDADVTGAGNLALEDGAGRNLAGILSVVDRIHMVVITFV